MKFSIINNKIWLLIFWFAFVCASLYLFLGVQSPENPMNSKTHIPILKNKFSQQVIEMSFAMRVKMSNFWLAVETNMKERKIVVYRKGFAALTKNGNNFFS